MDSRGHSFSAEMIVPPGTRLTDFEDEWKQAMGQKNPNVFQGNSIEELAIKIR